jgi:hypothetical protein
MYMEAGADFFDDLVAAGIVQPGHEPTREVAEEVWQRIGADLIDHWEEFYRGYPTRSSEPWAIEQFGPPKRTARRR